MRDVASVEDDGAVVRLDDAADRPQERRLAGTVRADDGDDLALADLDRDVGEDRDAVVAHPQLAHGEERQLAVVAVQQHLRPRAHGGPDVADVASEMRLPALATISPPTVKMGTSIRRP